MRHGWSENEFDHWGPQSREWRSAGKRIFRFVAVMLVALALVPLVIGLILAALIGGTESVLVALVSWIALVGLLAIGARFAMRSVGPVRDLISMAGSLADGDYSVRANPTAAMPFRPVVESFNSMADRLESAETERRQLLADIGHELRTPLTVIRGDLEAVVDGVRDFDHDQIARLLDDVSMMEHLLGDLRTLSTAEAGRLELHREETDVGRIGADVVERFRADAEASGVTLRVGGNRPPLLADIDPVRITEVITNLLRNALRATGSGDSIAIEFASTSDGTVVVRVTDTGAGISADQLDRVFERFHKGPESDGTGLGLTISRNLVEAHGGTLTMSSQVGEGTEVTILLPARDADVGT